MHEFINAFYEKIGTHEELNLIASNTDRNRAAKTQSILLELCENRVDSTRVLEIGPASGYITSAICEVLGGIPGASLDVMDISHEYLATVKAKELNVASYIQCDITGSGKLELDLELEYDIVLLQEVLEHLTSPISALININRLLRDGGFLFVTVPNSLYFRKLLFELFATDRFRRPANYLDAHISELSMTGLVKLVTMSGFDVVRADYYAPRLPVCARLTSPQVSLLLKKAGGPADRWDTLATNIVAMWSDKRMRV